MLRALGAGFRQREEQRQDGDDQRDFLVFGFDGVFQRLGDALIGRFAAARRAPAYRSGAIRGPWRMAPAEAECSGSLEPAGCA